MNIKRFTPYILPAVVFITGACVLIIEVVAVRVLSPYYGNTIFTVSSIISIILAALSFGYYIGGKYADAAPSQQTFYSIITWSGIIVAAFYLLAIMILPLLGSTLGLVAGPLASSILLFFIPAFFLGTLSPYAITLQSIVLPDNGIGSVTGSIFFYSTFGSITGSLLAGFVLIPRMGVDGIFLSVSIVLFIIGIIGLFVLKWPVRKLLILIVCMGALVVATSWAIDYTQEEMLYQTDGVYERISIYDGAYGDRPVRYLMQDSSASGALFLDTQDPTDLVYDYTTYYRLYKAYDTTVDRALIIGGGAYSMPRALLAELPDAEIYVSEIETDLYPLAQEYFKLQETPRLHNYEIDGRQMLENTDEDTSYDLIFSDVYDSLYSIPTHFTTREFFSLAKHRLSNDGIFVANLIGDMSRQEESFILSQIRTFKQVFPHGYVFATDGAADLGVQNVILVGHKQDKQIDWNSKSASAQDAFTQTLFDNYVNLQRYELSSYPIFTDNYAPVDYLIAQVLSSGIQPTSTVQGDRMMAIIEQQLRYGPRYIDSPGSRKLQQMLRAELEAHGALVERQAFTHTDNAGNQYQGANIIARLFPEQKNRIILGTHYDSKRLADLDSFNSHQPVPGANDSASGVAVLLELARVLHHRQATPQVGIDLVFFDGEEGEHSQKSDYSDWQPLGSKYFAETIRDTYPQALPSSAVVLDMVCDSDLQLQMELSSALQARKHTESLWQIGETIAPDVFEATPSQAIRDDHTALNAIGIPSVLMIDFEYPPFHTTRDTLDKCSGDSLEIVAKTVLEYLYALPLESQ